jgi:hypothetical protein
MTRQALHSLWLVLVAAPLASIAACDQPEDEPRGESMESVIEKVYEGALTMPQAQTACRCALETVRLGGTVFHFGLDLSQSPPVPYPFQSTVAGTQVWIAEAPITRKLNVRTDAAGRWSGTVIKLKGQALPISFVYERPGYVTTKSPVVEVADTAITDLAVQFPSAAYFALAKADIEQKIGALIGAPYTLRNVLVTTVGKSWASMYNTQLPHGDPGVTVAISPAVQFPLSVGPIYFNEAVAPDPTLGATSVDGGVMFGNLPAGANTISASKTPFSYTSLTFRVQDDIGLYIASPPHATQGTNTSGPGMP